jgi:hypothetical protein
MKAWRSILVLAVLMFLPMKHSAGQSQGPPTMQPLVVTVTPWGPDQNAIDAARAMVVSHPSVRRYLDGTRNRLLSLQLLDSPIAGQPPNGIRIVFYDYTNNRAVIATAKLGHPESVSAITSSEQPVPSGEEFNAALDLVRRDPYFGPLLTNGSMTSYRPMPPVIDAASSFGQNQRTITVGLLPRKSTARHEIVGVNLIQGTVIRYPDGAPPTSMANEGTCGLPPAGQGSNPGQASYELTISQGSTTLWTMLVTRPAASSGTNGSAIEVQNVDYLGKRVLKRGGVPILNVQYVNNACGPYRDWQNQEGMFHADNADPVTHLCPVPNISGFCSGPAQTILDDGTDVGNFNGVAYYTTGTEVVLVTEMEAGWYRYVNEWRFDVNGTIRPRFRFGTTASSCVCHTHTHHAYFRLDFDIAGSEKNVIWEVNGRWMPIRRTTEMMSPRSPTWNRRWIIENAGTGDKYMVIPRTIDGLYDTYGRGDVWLLRYHQDAELDDCTAQHPCSVGGNTEIDLAQFVNGESIDKQDVVMWYGTHDVHIGGTEDTDAVGPDIVPVSW